MQATLRSAAQKLKPAAPGLFVLVFCRPPPTLRAEFRCQDRRE
jgi:hypothetical protein